MVLITLLIILSTYIIKSFTKISKKLNVMRPQDFREDVATVY